ncbi:protein O-glucosyltransferase 2-like [Ornithodoros turicata]|uniref:protein O-glucosyltransferase 2-like n=1 Tax=Ornithodoros turicata TaxID=34597 RepID=UPI00313A187B
MPSRQYFCGKSCAVRHAILLINATLLLQVASAERCAAYEECQVVASQTFSKELSKVFGPGLRSTFRTPARYFFVQAVDTSGNNFTSSPPGKLTVNIGGTQGHCSIWSQVLDRGDGLFIVRYRLFRTCPEAKIEVLYNNSPLLQSPFVLKGPLYHEACSCPMSYEEWLREMDCSPTDPQILRDLEQFGDAIDMKAAVKNALERFHRPGSISFCHYAVLNNKVYRSCYGQHVGFNMFMDAILLSLTRKVVLPDVEMLVNLGDWPLEQNTFKGTKVPFFSWCGSRKSSDIVMPTYDLTESSLEMMGRVMLDVLSVQGHPGPSWKDKEIVGFWRGRDSREERLRLVRLSRKHPDVINASLTNFFFFRDQEKEYGPRVDHVSFFHFFKYKYQINVDGTVAAYRMPYLLAGNGLVLKQDSEYYEHFYADLVPMQHYVPFRQNLTDLVEKILWARNNDEKAYRISKEAGQFALDHLLPHHVFCYYTHLLNEFARRLVHAPSVTEEMELVPQVHDEFPCQCDDSSHRDEL